MSAQLTSIVKQCSLPLLVASCMLGGFCASRSGMAGATPSSAAGPVLALSVLAGAPSGQGYRDGLRASARFSVPMGMRFDNSGNLYLADARNNLIRKIDTTGLVSTVAGRAAVTGSPDGAAAAATLVWPWLSRVAAAACPWGLPPGGGIGRTCTWCG